MIYTTQPGDSLPSIAESFGHSGEWQALVYFNGSMLSDYNNIQPGTELVVPDEWAAEMAPVEPPPAKSTSTRSSSSSTTSSA